MTTIEVLISELKGRANACSFQSDEKSLLTRAAKELEALTRQVRELKGRVIDHHYSGCPDCNEIINRIDNDWLDGIAKLWNERHPGKIYGVRDGETREEGLSANLSFIFDELDDSQSSLTLSQAKVVEMREALIVAKSQILSSDPWRNKVAADNFAEKALSTSPAQPKEP